MLKKGTLWQSIVKTAEQALESGALAPIPTDHVFVEDGGMRFFIRVLAGLGRKDEARKKQDAEAKAGKRANPFLPPERELTVADVSDTHVAVLNKFNVVDHHLLIVTRNFEDQDTLLTPKDFEALWLCMAEYDSLGFYNGGREAGASQQHKHLQMVPLPLTPEGPKYPVEPLLAGAGKGTARLTAVPAFSFLHSFAWLDPHAVRDPSDAARTTFDLYAGMLRSVGLNIPGKEGLVAQSAPYCLLATREWMLLVPRSKEFFEDISLNSLAFAGSLFVRNAEQLARLRAYGPMKALAQVAVKKSGGGR